MGETNNKEHGSFIVFLVFVVSPIFAINSPAEISGLRLWLDGADSGSISLQALSNYVTQWRDKSGNNLHFNQSNTGRFPYFTPSGLNGNSLISFDGNDYISKVNYPTKCC